MGMMLMIHHIMHAVCAVDYIPSPQSKFLYDVNIISKSGSNRVFISWSASTYNSCTPATWGLCYSSKTALNSSYSCVAVWWLTNGTVCVKVDIFGLSGKGVPPSLWAEAWRTTNDDSDYLVYSSSIQDKCGLCKSLVQYHLPWWWLKTQAGLLWCLWQCGKFEGLNGKMFLANFKCHRTRICCGIM